MLITSPNVQAAGVWMSEETQCWRQHAACITQVFIILDLFHVLSNNNHKPLGFIFVSSDSPGVVCSLIVKKLFYKQKFVAFINQPPLRKYPKWNPLQPQPVCNVVSVSKPQHKPDGLEIKLGRCSMERSLYFFQPFFKQKSSNKLIVFFLVIYALVFSCPTGFFCFLVSKTLFEINK